MRSLHHDCRRYAGQFLPGDVLPSTRAVARLLGVHHVTVANAYRNLAADEGDARFMDLRRAAMEPILAAMVSLMERSGASKKHPLIVPGSAALAMSAILDRLAAYHSVVESGGVSREDLIGTSAQILFRTLTGNRASAAVHSYFSVARTL